MRQNGEVHGRPVPEIARRRNDVEPQGSPRDQQRGERQEEQRMRSQRSGKVEAVPNKKEVGEHNLGHAVFRSWCPRCVKGLAEAHGHKKRGGDVGDAPTVSLD